MGHDDPILTEPQSIKAAHSKGVGTITIGDKFKDDNRDGIEWEVIGWTARSSYGPFGIGGTSTVVCKPLAALPGWWKQWAREDGNVDWCADSVAGIMSRQQATSVAQD